MVRGEQAGDKALAIPGRTFLPQQSPGYRHRTPDRGADLPVIDTTPVEELKTSLQEQTIRAIAEMRLSTALQNLVTLERVREFAERGTAEFDSADLSGLSVPISRSRISSAPRRPCR